MDSKFTILKIIRIDEILDNHEDMLEGIDTVFFIDVHSKDRNEIMKYCVQNNILSFVVPRIGDTLMMSAENMHFFHLPIFRVTKYNPKIEYLIVKRLIDIIASLLGIIILSPVMIIVAIFVKSDGGPVFYKQVRLTQNGKKFDVLKFRSMRVDAESNGKAVLSAGENDPRITKVGRVIRAIRFDELPQLINILKGDMTIVGPRPERPEIAEEYYETIPEFRLRLQCKAGLTGYAQVYGKYNTEPYDKLLMDLMYIAKPSLLEDLRIIFATVKILFMKDSTEGIDVNQNTAMK
jgi:lipopolysaccharide/colanic/teichoic acid biosynthesis glycosyltransferase